MKILNFPLSKIILGHLLGVLIGFYAKPSLEITLSILALAFFLCTIAFLFQKKWHQSNYLVTFLAVFCSVSIGMLTLVFHTETNYKNHYTHHDSFFEKDNLLRISILEKIKTTPKNQRYIAQINQVDQTQTTGKVLINIAKENAPKNIETGTQILVRAQLLKNKPPYNPNQFDYGRYLENQQIYAQLYLKSKTYLIAPFVEKNIGYYIASIRTKIIQNLEKSDFATQERNVALALILGQRQELSPEVMQDYQFAGAIHILSVSGLHIGYIMIFLNFIMRPISNNKKGLFIKLLITITSLWFFAFITGMSASVVRSVVMFSFVTMAYYLRRGKNAYYTILVSLYLILLFQPYFLFDVGFQLSYLALFFIIWLQPLMANLWKPKNSINKTIWDILTVSFAAQIGTLPLSLYYFHQFPGLFFATNLIVFPFLGFIMVLGIVVVILASISITPNFLIKPLEWSIYAMDYCINWIASFKSFVIQDLSFNTYLLVSVYFCTITLIIWLKKPQFYKLVWVLMSIVVLQFSWIKTQYHSHKKEELIVFSQKKNSMIALRKGQEVRLYGTDSILKNASTNTTLKSYLTANFSFIKKKLPIKNYLYFKKNKILILDSTGVYLTKNQPDVILLTQSPAINIDRLLTILHPKIVVADASNFKSMQRNWRKSCQKKSIPFHSITEKGFYRIE